MAGDTTTSVPIPVIHSGEIGEFVCPVCRIGLARSDFEQGAGEYYCPFCSTRQTPTVA